MDTPLTEVENVTPPASDKDTEQEGQSLVGDELLTFPITVVTLRGDKFNIQVSPVDTVQDVRQYLFESAEACDLTSYSLHLNGAPINDFVELSKIEKLGTGSVLHMVEAPYNKRSALLHIRRLREILSFHLFNFSNSPSPSLFSYFSPPDDDTEEAEKSGEGKGAAQTKGSQKKGKGKKGGNNDKNSSDHPAPAINPLYQLKSSKEEIAEIDSVSLENFYPAPTAPAPPCVTSIEFSGWNPPPGNRSLLGDLYYLEVTTLEGKTVHITCWTGGFYVNNSDSFTFDPTPAAKPYRSHHLSGVLSQLSNQFKKNLVAVLKSGQFGKHPFELMAVSIPVTPWIGPPVEDHPYDNNRSEYSILYTEIDYTGNLRDWNEEYQSCKELPKSTVQERITRDRNIVKVHYDFVDAATKGAMAIAAGTIPPINPVEEADKHMFVYNNIFFSYAYDTREQSHKAKGKGEKKAAATAEEKDTPAAAEKKEATTAGGETAEKKVEDKNVDQGTYVSANNDLRAIRAFNEADVTGLSTVLTAIIDYRGYRLFAQSLIPGVMQKEETNVLYGSLDRGKTIVSDAKFHELVGEASKVLHLKEHEVTDGKGETKKLFTPANVKGIVGTDGRRYFVDFVRATPLDANYLKAGEEEEDDHYARNEAVLRPELIAMFAEAKDLKLLGDELSKTEKAKEESAKDQDEKKEGESSEATAAPEEGKGKEKETPAKEGGEGETAAASAEGKEGDEEGKEKADNFVFNPNALVSSKYFKLGGSKEEIEKDEELVRSMAVFLKEALIPRLAEEFLSYVSIPVDGQTLTSIMHRNGVNMRYLGYLARLCRFRPMIAHLCEQEMITRAAKHQFARLMRGVEGHLVAHATSHFLNCLLGDAKSVSAGLDVNALSEEETAGRVKKPALANGHAEEKGAKGKKKKGSNKGGNNTNAAAAGSNTESQKEKKKYPAPKGEIFSLSTQTLWSTIQTLVKERYDYDLSTPVPVEGVDKASLETVRQRVRELPTLRSFCLKVGVQVAARNYDFGTAEPFNRADILDIYPLVKHLNPKSADGQHLLEAGKVFLSQGRLDVAFELFNEALAIFHQVYGPMHPDTAICYGNLAMVHYHANDTAQALVHQKKMVIINERVMGLDHHETAHSYGNLALFGRDLKKPGLLEASLKCIKRAHYLSKLVSGPRHPDSPNTLGHMANMYQDLGRRDLALKYNLEALEANHYFFGEGDNLQTATICHQIAMLYNEMDLFREALNYEKRNYNILCHILGEKDFRTNESNIWLKQFTIKAVKSQIELKKAQQDITSKISGEKIERFSTLSQRAGAAKGKPTLRKTFGN